MTFLSLSNKKQYIDYQVRKEQREVEARAKATEERRLNEWFQKCMTNVTPLPPHYTAWVESKVKYKGHRKSSDITKEQVNKRRLAAIEYLERIGDYLEANKLRHTHNSQLLIQEQYDQYL